MSWPGRLYSILTSPAATHILLTPEVPCRATGELLLLLKARLLVVRPHARTLKPALCAGLTIPQVMYNAQVSLLSRAALHPMKTSH